MKKSLISFFALVASFCAGARDEALLYAMSHGADFDMQLKVVDDDGSPVPDARCAGWMFVDSDRKHGKGYSECTDNDGCVHLKGKSSHWVRIVITKKGYYGTTLEVKYPNRKSSVPVVDGKWQPYGEQRMVVLKRIKAPGKLRAFPYSLRTCKIPKFDEWLGFDFECCDWIPPHGCGKHDDVLLRFYSHDNRKNIHDYRFVMEVSFTNNPFAGAYSMKQDETSEFATVYEADSNAVYQATFTYLSEQTPGNPRRLEFLDNDTYLIFRTRTRVDQNGKLLGAHYGKILGRWLSGSQFMILSDGCFNPVENDTNIEDGGCLRDVLRNKESPK